MTIAGRAGERGCEGVRESALRKRDSFPGAPFLLCGGVSTIFFGSWFPARFIRRGTAVSAHRVSPDVRCSAAFKVVDGFDSAAISAKNIHARIGSH